MTIADIKSGQKGHEGLHKAIRARLLSVKEFGAVGDGVADDTVAFEAIAEAMRSSGGGAVYIPRGVYKCTRPIVWRTNQCHIKIYGDGPKSVIKYTAVDGSDCWTFEGSNWSDIASPAPTLSIRDLTLVGSSEGGSAIVLHDVINPTSIDCVGVSGFGWDAVRLVSCWPAQISNVWAHGCKNGISITNNLIPGQTGSSINIKITGCHLQGNNDHGIYIPKIEDKKYTVNHITIDNCIIEGNHGGGIVAYGAQNLNVQNIYFELNNGAEWADIFLEHCLCTTTTNCGSHAPAPYWSVKTDSTCKRMVFINNNWQGNVRYGGELVHEINSSHTETGVWSNYHTDHSEINLPKNDPNPSVEAGNIRPDIYYTANTVPTTIESFTDAYNGHRFIVIINDDFTSLKFNGVELTGNSGEDYKAAKGDAVSVIAINGRCYCEIIRQ